MYIFPGQDIGALTFAQQQAILNAAASDDGWLRTLDQEKRKDIIRAARQLPNPGRMRLRSALLAIVNHVTAIAAERGEYNEWPALAPTVNGDDRHIRPFMAMLHVVALSGANPVVWTCGEVKPGELRLKRAIFNLGGPDIKVSEYWPISERRAGYPALETFALEPRG